MIVVTWRVTAIPVTLAVDEMICNSKGERVLPVLMVDTSNPCKNRLCLINNPPSKRDLNGKSTLIFFPLSHEANGPESTW